MSKKYDRKIKRKEKKLARVEGKLEKEQIRNLANDSSKPKSGKEERLQKKKDKVSLKLKNLNYLKKREETGEYSVERKKGRERIERDRRVDRDERYEYKSGGSVGDSVKTYSSGGYVEGK